MYPAKVTSTELPLLYCSVLASSESVGGVVVWPSLALSLVQLLSTDLRRPSPVLYHLVQTNCCLEVAIIQFLCIPWRLGLVQDPMGLCVVLSHDCHPPETPQDAAHASSTSPAREHASWCKCMPNSRMHAVGLYTFGGMVKAAGQGSCFSRLDQAAHQSPAITVQYI